MANLITKPETWNIYNDLSIEEFVLGMLTLGKPYELSLVGHFDDSGRGSRRDIDLPLHRDGDYSVMKGKPRPPVDYVGFYCIRPGAVATTMEYEGYEESITLKKGQAVVIDNRKCRHGRTGDVGDRLLIRLWIDASGK